MSHINLYSLPTDLKNMIRCRFCEKIYKIDNGSSGFIRHLRCKHPEVLYKMGSLGTNEGHADTPGNDQRLIYNSLISPKTEIQYNENMVKTETGVEEQGMIIMEDVSNNDILANFVSQMGFVNTRAVDKRPRVSPILMGMPNPTGNVIEERNEEPEVKIFNGGETLKNFLIDIENHVRLQTKEVPEVLNENGDASTSASAVDVPSSPKGSREPSPNSSMLGEPNGGPETVDSPLQSNHGPLHPFGCVFCPCSFQAIKDLTLHVGTVHRTRFRCNSCLAEFVQPQHLEHHFTMCHVTDTTPNNQ